MRYGVPEGWQEAIARPISAMYGRSVALERADDGRQNAAGSMVDVYCDGNLAGGLEVSWSDEERMSAVLAELRERVEELLAQELGGGV
jgi:hypothetical protein